MGCVSKGTKHFDFASSNFALVLFAMPWSRGIRSAALRADLIRAAASGLCCGYAGETRPTTHAHQICTFSVDISPVQGRKAGLQAGLAGVPAKCARPWRKVL